MGMAAGDCPHVFQRLPQAGASAQTPRLASGPCRRAGGGPAGTRHAVGLLVSDWELTRRLSASTVGPGRRRPGMARAVSLRSTGTYLLKPGVSVILPHAAGNAPFPLARIYGAG